MAQFLRYPDILAVKVMNSWRYNSYGSHCMGGGGITKQDPGRYNSLKKKKKGGGVSDSVTDGGVTHPVSYRPDTKETFPVRMEVVPICTVSSKGESPTPRIPST